MRHLPSSPLTSWTALLPGEATGELGHSRQFLDRVADGNDFTIMGPPHLEEWRSRCSATGFALHEHQEPSAFFPTSVEVM
jgi:hypothetical protein